MLSIKGAGSQYCWSVWRRPLGKRRATDAALTIDEIRVTDAHQPSASRARTLVVSGLDLDRAGVNDVIVRIGDLALTPGRVVRTRRGSPSAHVDIVIPAAIPAGETTLVVETIGPAASRSTPVPFVVPAAEEILPVIALITNGVDGGLDLETHGDKAGVRLFVDHLTHGLGMVSPGSSWSSSAEKPSSRAARASSPATAST